MGKWTINSACRKSASARLTMMLSLEFINSFLSHITQAFILINAIQIKLCIRSRIVIINRDEQTNAPSLWVPVCTFIIRTYLFQFEEFHWYNYCRTCEFRGRASQFCSATMIFLSDSAPHVWFSWPHFWFQKFTDILQNSSAHLLNICISLSVPAFRRNCGESGRAAQDGISYSRDHIDLN